MLSGGNLGRLRPGRFGKPWVAGGRGEAWVSLHCTERVPLSL